MRSIEEFKEVINALGAEKKKRNKRRSIAMISTCCLLVVCVVCAAVLIPPKNAVGRNNNYKYVRPEGTDLMASLRPVAVNSKAAPNEAAKELTEFGLNLFKATVKDGENALISPLSAIAVLGMVANGDDSQTLAQMEKAFGLPVDKLNDYLYSYVGSLPHGDKYKLDMANSIWFRDDGSLQVNQDFLQKNADYYGAAAYAEPFDETTVKNINDWVSKNTDGMIKEIVDKLNPQEMLHLINALAFEAKWDVPYETYQVYDDVTFTREDGTEDKVRMMESTESVYYSGIGFEGFAKPYKDGKYSFVALLPSEGNSVSKLLESLDGAKLYEILSSPQSGYHVEASIPKFEIEYDAQLANALKSMGMEDLFDSQKAELTGIGTVGSSKLFIGSVIQKTYISVDENGTKAAAVTDAIAYATGYDPMLRFVNLDRPFIYMLVDNQTNTPFFIGTVMELGE